MSECNVEIILSESYTACMFHYISRSIPYPVIIYYTYPMLYNKHRIHNITYTNCSSIMVGLWHCFIQTIAIVYSDISNTFILCRRWSQCASWRPWANSLCSWTTPRCWSARSRSVDFLWQNPWVKSMGKMSVTPLYWPSIWGLLEMILYPLVNKHRPWKSPIFNGN